MKKRKRILSFVLVLAMLFCVNVPAPAYAAEGGYTYLSSQEMYNWMSTQTGYTIRPQTLEQAERCINDFHPCEWRLGMSKEDVLLQIASLTDSLVSGKASITEKARAIFDWVSQNVIYDDTAFAYHQSPEAMNTPEKSQRVREAADAFYAYCQRRAICEGYAKLSQLMLTIAEIPVAYISGESRDGIAHAWNAVCVDRGWILFDATGGIWEMNPNFHNGIGTIQFCEGPFCRSLSIDGAVWHWIVQGYPCPADVVIPNGVVEIGTESYLNCTGMTSVTIPDGVREIGISAFEGCTNLTSVTIPASVTTIRRGAFKNCSSLASITYLGAMPHIEEDAFSGTLWMQGQGDFVINGTTLVQYNGSDRNVVIPSGVTAIADKAFDVNLWISSVVIPEGVTSIGKQAFRQCISLTDVTLPSTVNTIGEDAFYLTPWQKKQGDYSIVNGILLRYQGADERNVVIPAGVTTIADGALYYNCKNTRCLFIPASVTQIGDFVLNHSFLEEVYYEGSKAQWDAVSIVGGSTNWKFRDESTVIHYNVPMG